MIPDTPPPRPPAVRPVQRFDAARNGTNGTHDTKGPTLEQVVQTIREGCEKVREATERVTVQTTPPDGVPIKLPSESKAIKRLRQLRDRKKA